MRAADHVIGAAAEKPAISFFERWLTLWVALCIVAGIALGQVAPAFTPDDAQAIWTAVKGAGVLDAVAQAHQRRRARDELGDAALVDAHAAVDPIDFAAVLLGFGTGRSGDAALRKGKGRRWRKGLRKRLTGAPRRYQTQFMAKAYTANVARLSPALEKALAEWVKRVNRTQGAARG